MQETRGKMSIRALALITLIACLGCDARLPAGDAKVLRLGGLARADTIAAAPPEEAVRLYLLTVQHIRPFDVRSQNVIARRGDEVAVALTRELESASTDVVRWGCIVALGRMDDVHAGLVSRDSSRMRVVGVAIGVMRDGFYREDSQGVLDHLRSGR